MSEGDYCINLGLLIIEGGFNKAIMNVIFTVVNKVISSVLTRCLRLYHLVKKTLQLFKDHGLKLLLCLIVHKLARECISFLYRISLPKLREGSIVKEVLGSKMYLDLSDEGISRDLIMDGIREVMQTELFQREVKQGDIVVDLGANIGYYALLEAKIIGDKGKVYAIEPVPSNIELLRKSVEVNKYSNVETYQLAIGDASGFHSMYLSTHRNKPTLRDITGTNKEQYFTEIIQVEVVTLDDFMKDKPYPNIIRMDVEGYEYQIIKGMRSILQRKLPLLLCIEFHFHLLKERESIEILETLKSAGFQRVDVLAMGMIRGRNRHKLLSRLMSLVEPTIEKELNQSPVNRHLKWSIDDILSNHVMLSGQWGGKLLIFRRD